METQARHYEPGQQLDVHILPEYPLLSERVAQELSNRAILCQAGQVLIAGLGAPVLCSFGFLFFQINVKECRNEAIVLLCVAYVIEPALVLIALCCCFGFRRKDFHWSTRTSTSHVVEDPIENQENDGGSVQTQDTGTDDSFSAVPNGIQII